MSFKDYIINNIRLQKKIGGGNFSNVYLGYNEITNKYFGVKIIQDSNLQTQNDFERLQKEINISSLLIHKNLNSLIDVFYQDQNFFLIFEYSSGGNLLEYICEKRIISEEIAFIIFRQILDGIYYLHQNNIVHRDIKLENILIDIFPNIKLTDFGFSEYFDGENLLNTFCGTLAYISPECLLHKKFNGFQSDIWSLGVLLYVLVTGSYPWSVKKISITKYQILNGLYEIPSNISSSLNNLISKLLKINPIERISIPEIYNHEWFRKFEFNFQNEFKIIPKEIIQNQNSGEKLFFNNVNFIYYPLSLVEKNQICICKSKYSNSKSFPHYFLKGIKRIRTQELKPIVIIKPHLTKSCQKIKQPLPIVY